MSSRADRILKAVWLAASLVFLAVVAGVLFIVLSDVWPDRGGAVRVGAPAEREKEGGGEKRVPRAIRYAPPAAVRGTATRMVMVFNGDADQRAGSGYYSSGSGTPQGPQVNVIFLAPGAPARLLLDHPAYVAGVSYPAAGDPGEVEVSPGRGGRADTLQTWITYEIADRDTNGDGKLDEADRAGLFVSALDGTGLRRVLPEPFWLLDHSLTPDRRGMLVMALEPPRGRDVPREEMRQRAFLYDVATGALTPFAALDGAADRAARIVGR